MTEIENTETIQHKNIAAEYKASILRRLLAFLVDNMVLIALSILLFYYFFPIDLLKIWNDSAYFAEQVFILCLVHQFYFFVFEFASHGTTLGKWIFDIKAVSKSGDKLNLLSVVVRNFTRATYLLPPFFFLPDIICLFLTAFKKRIGDLVAGTIVIKMD